MEDCSRFARHAAAAAPRLGAAGLGLGLRAMEHAIRSTARDGNLAYFDIEDFPWTAPLEASWREVRAELDGVLADRERIPAFEAISEAQRSITNDGRWTVFVLSVFGRRIAPNCRRCPRTASLLDGIPGLGNAMFSILAPRKRIPSHRGPYNGLLRFHLALKVPAAGADCVLTVDGVRRTWREGRSIVFDDSFDHSVDNATDEERVVLFADFERPLAPPLRLANRAAIAMLSRTELARQPLERLERGME